MGVGVGVWLGVAVAGCWCVNACGGCGCCAWTMLLGLVGSRDGFSNQAFHETCDGCSPTITIVLLHNGRIFGGYTSIPWSSIGGPHADEEAFIFTLTDGTAIEEGGRPPCRLFQFQNRGYAVWHAKDQGPLFGAGAGADLGLNLDNMQRSRSNCGITYAIPRWVPRTKLSTQLVG